MRGKRNAWPYGRIAESEKMILFSGRDGSMNRETYVALCIQVIILQFAVAVASAASPSISHRRLNNDCDSSYLNPDRL